MSSTARPDSSSPIAWDAIAGARGPGRALTVFLLGVVLVLACLPGMWWLPSAILEPVRFFELIWSLKRTDLMISIPVLIGLASGISIFGHRRETRPRLRRLLVSAMIVVAVPTILIGGTVWTGSGRLNYVVLVLIQSALLFSLLWSVRTLALLVASAASSASKALIGIAMGLAGAAIVAAAVSAVAALRGAELERLDSTHVFYIWIVPALAGFGWGAPRPQSRSRLFAVSVGLLVLLVVWYAVPVHFAEPPRVECDYPYEKPRHVAYGFELEPWRWKVDRSYAWLAAPGTFAELTLRHIWQPLIGFTCTGTGDLPPELL